MHTGMMVNVRNGGVVSDTFAITNGVKQECVLTHTLFSILLMETESASNHDIMQTSLQVHISERRQTPQIYL